MIDGLGISTGPNNLQHHPASLTAGFFASIASLALAFFISTPMKLNERQVELRAAFRDVLLKNWRSPGKTLMCGVYYDVADRFGIDKRVAKEELCALPSIRHFTDTTPIHVWLAKHYPAVSNAMFDGKSDDQCLAIWRTSKYSIATSATSKRSNEEKKEMAQCWNKGKRKLKAIAELQRNAPDRWANTSWNIVK